MTIDWREKMTNRTKLVFSMALVATSLFVGEAFAAPQCSTIQNADQRAYCRSVATNSRGNCSGISDWNLRQQCNARLGAPVAPTCSSVPLGWQREACKDAARARR